MTVSSERMEQLEAALRRQEAEIAELRSELASVKAGAPEGARPDVREPALATARSSRRAVLVGGAVAAGAAIAGAAVRPGTAAAADGSNMQVGRLNSSDGADTRVRSNTAGALSGVNIFTVTDDQSTSSYEAAIGAVAQGVKVHNGMYSYTSSRTTSTTTGHAVVARKASGGRSHIFMPPSSSAPTNDTYGHAAGELRVDSSRILWYCTNSGTPGRWVRLAGPQSSGAVHALSPKRVYDSRLSGGPLSSGSDRVVSVADAIDDLTGVVVATNFVPVGATAIMFNLTITETTGSGFVFVAPGDTPAITSSTINWSVSGTTIANGSFTTVDSARQIKAFVSGGGSTHFIIDVTGYTL